MKTSLSNKTLPIHQVTLDPIWPVLDLPILAYIELEKDELFPLMDQSTIPVYINQSIEKGQLAAKRFGKNITFQKLLNQLLKERVRITFVPHISKDGMIRAVYNKKKRIIEISRSSIQQIRSFFLTMGISVPEEDISLMHLVHEWFHHLEENTIGRTDRALPSVPYKKIGPLVLKKKVAINREIAAHAFTQSVLHLPWSPLLLDYLITFREQGESISTIRQHFQKVKQKALSILEPTSNNKEDGTDHDQLEK